MVKFIIVRHGFSMGNKEKRFSGQLDVPLDEVGRSQAVSVADYICENFKVDAIYSSDLSRAYDSVKLISDRLSLPVVKTKELREVDVGLWQGMLIEDVEKKYPESFEEYRRNPGLSRFDGGEGYIDVMKRASAELYRIANENEGKTIVIGTHGGVIRTLRAVWGNIPPENIKDIPHVANGSITIVIYDGDEIRLEVVGYTDHLSDKTTEVGVAPTK